MKSFTAIVRRGDLIKLSHCIFAAMVFLTVSGLSASRRAPAPAVPNVSSVYFDTRTPAVVAHRGAADREARENGFHEGTMEAYYYAAGLGVEVLEMDIHLTTDGRLAVHHDDKLPRSCYGKDKVSKLTMGRLKACRWSLGYEIPELREILSAFRGRRMTIEMKTPDNSLFKRYTGIENVLWSEIRRYGMERYVSISSVNGTSVKNFRALQNGVPTGLSAGEQVSFLLCYMARLPQWACAGVPRDEKHMLETPYLHKDLELLGVTLPLFSLVTDSFVSQAHRYNYILNYWTVNNAADIRRVYRVGADGVITDNPALAQSLR